MSKNNSFISNVNKLADKLDAILLANNYFDPEVVETLIEIKELDIDVLIGDLKKNSYLGNKKLDINLLDNLIKLEDYYNDSDRPKYDSATIIFIDGSKHTLVFKDTELVKSPISTNTELQTAFSLYMRELTTKITGTELLVIPIEGSEAITRFSNAVGDFSNIEMIELHAVSGKFKEATTIHYWLKTTSALEVLSGRIDELIRLGVNTETFTKLSKYITELLSIYNKLPMLVGTPSDQTIYTKLNELLDIHRNLAEVLAAKGYSANANTSATIASSSSQIAQNAASLALESATRAEKAIATTATPTVRGVVFTASPTDVESGLAGRVVDASQLKQQLDNRVGIASTSKAGIMKKATWSDVQNRSGDEAITPATIGAYIPDGFEEQDYPRLEIGTNSNDLLRTILSDKSQQNKIFRLSGKIVITVDSDTARINYPSEIIANTKCVLTQLIGTYAPNLSVQERPESINSTSYVDLGIYDTTADAWVKGSFYVDISGKILNSQLPQIPTGFTASSLVSYEIVINKV